METADQDLSLFVFASVQFNYDTGQFLVLIFDFSHFFQFCLEFSIVFGELFLFSLKPLDFQRLGLSLDLKFFQSGIDILLILVCVESQRDFSVLIDTDRLGDLTVVGFGQFALKGLGGLLFFECQEVGFAKELPLLDLGFLLLVYFEFVFAQSLAVLLGQKQLKVDFLLFHFNESLVDLSDGCFEFLNDDVLLDDFLADLVFLFLVLGDFLDIGKGLLVLLLIDYEKLLKVSLFLELFLEFVYFLVELLDFVFMLLLLPKEPVFERFDDFLGRTPGALKNEGILNPEVGILVEVCLV